jgi:hypothetical protein
MQLMGIAEFIIGRAFARPVGSTHPTALNRLSEFLLRWHELCMGRIDRVFLITEGLQCLLLLSLFSATASYAWRKSLPIVSSQASP